MSSPKHYESIQDAAISDPIVHAFLRMIESGSVTKDKGYEMLILALANERAHLLASLAGVAAQRPVVISMGKDG